MTTRVTMLNHGPDPVVVITADGIGLKNVQQPKYDDCQKTTVEPGQHREFYVHQSQSLMVLEKERP